MVKIYRNSYGLNDYIKIVAYNAHGFRTIIFEGHEVDPIDLVTIILGCASIPSDELFGVELVGVTDEEMAKL